MSQTTLVRTVRLGVSSLLLHKLRSLLTTLGVLFGTSSVIAMLAIGEGASSEAQETIKRLGSQNVILRSVKPPDDPATAGQQSRVISYGLTVQDYERARDTFPGVDRVVPVRQVMQEVRNRDKVLRPRILCTTPEYEEVAGRMVWEGRFLTDRDSAEFANVCVLGTEVARQLFPLTSPLGARVRIGSDYFEVVGTVAPRTPRDSDPGKPGEDVTEEVFLPLATAQRWFGEMQVQQRTGGRDMEEVQLHELVLEIDDLDNVVVVAEASRAMLERYHRKQDYEVVVPLELLAQAEETKRIFNIVLGSIAGISLLVGGIGIMNVMLATVTERTREIGIRRALGAKRHHIVSQFLVETVVLSVGGGLLGVALGLLIPIAVEYWADMRTVVTPGAPLLAFFISAGVGVVFGLYPAWRAAAMDPVEALRHE